MGSFLFSMWKSPAVIIHEMLKNFWIWHQALSSELLACSHQFFSSSVHLGTEIGSKAPYISLFWPRNQPYLCILAYTKWCTCTCGLLHSYSNSNSEPQESFMIQEGRREQDEMRSAVWFWEAVPFMGVSVRLSLGRIGMPGHIKKRLGNVCRWI